MDVLRLGADGLDEVSISDSTRIAEVRDAQVRTYEVTPEEFGLARAPIETISGGDAAENAKIIREVLRGKKSPCRDVVLLNAAATLVASGRANHLSEAMPLAINSIDSGAKRGISDSQTWPLTFHLLKSQSAIPFEKSLENQLTKPGKRRSA